MGCFNPSSNNVAFVNQPLAADVAVTANTTTTVASITLSALPAACGTNACRVRLSYSYYASGGTLGLCYVSDGTNTYGASGAVTVNNFTLCGATLLTPQQFSSGATPTFTILIFDEGATSVCAFRQIAPSTAACAVGSGLQSYMQAEVLPSN